MWVQRVVRSRAFRLFDRICSAAMVVGFAVLTWQSPPQTRSVLGFATALSLLVAAAAWYQTRPAASVVSESGKRK